MSSDARTEIIELLAVEMQETTRVTLTQGEILFISLLLSKNLQPRSEKMMEFSIKLMTRFKNAMAKFECNQ